MITLYTSYTCHQETLRFSQTFTCFHGILKVNYHNLPTRHALVSYRRVILSLYHTGVWLSLYHTGEWYCHCIIQECDTVAVSYKSVILSLYHTGVWLSLYHTRVWFCDWYHTGEWFCHWYYTGVWFCHCYHTGEWFRYLSYRSVILSLYHTGTWFCHCIIQVSVIVFLKSSTTLLNEVRDVGLCWSYLLPCRISTTVLCLFTCQWNGSSGIFSILFLLCTVFYGIIFSSVHKTAQSDYYLRHVCPSLRSHGTTRLPLDGYSQYFIFEDFFEILSIKFKFHYNLTRITGTSHEDQYTVLIISCLILLRMRNVSDTRCGENQNTHFVSNNFFFLRNSCRLWEKCGKIL